MVAQGQMRMILRTFLSLLTASAIVSIGAAQAAVLTGQGTWYGTDGTDGTLRGRDINGNPINLLVAGAPNPDLVFVFDTRLNLTWLANWNVNGAQNWATAKSWAEGLSYTIGSVVVDDWVLPGVTDTGSPGCDFSYTGGTDCGYNLYSGEAQRRGSPLAHMFYDTLGNLAYCPPGNTTCSGAGVPQPGWGLTNTGPFGSSMQSGYYWSGTEYAPDTADAWHFDTSTGYQRGGGKVISFYAVAVRPGDVAAAPEPGLLALLGIAVAGLAATRRRRQ